MNESFAEYIESILPEGWEYESEYGSDGNLICPHGHTIEQDGHCPEGCESPLLRSKLEAEVAEAVECR